MAAVRDLGIVAWLDPSSKLEAMTGAEWRSIITEENQRFANYLRHPAIQARIPAYEASLAAAEAQVDRPWFALNYGGRATIDIYPNGNAGLEWTFTGAAAAARHEASDVDVSEAPNPLMVYSVVEVGGGAHLYELRAQAGAAASWTIKDVGPSVAVAGGRVYYLRPQKKLWYFQLWSADAATGAGERLEFEQKDPKYNLYLQKCAGRQLYLLADNNGYTKLWSITPNGLEALDLDAIYHIPCDTSRIVLTTAGNWEIRGPKGARALPATVVGDPYFYSSATRLILTRHEGAVHLYLDGVLRETFPAASVLPDTYLLWSTYGATAAPLYVKSPPIPPTLLMVHGNGTVQTIFQGEKPSRVSWSSLMAKSADGTKVPCGYVSQARSPRALLIVMYGAYGAPTAPGYVEKQWAPLLEAGWAIGYAFVRGGGDNGWAWAESARRTGRIRAIEDAEACVAAIRAATGVLASRTAIYGRSAGGILIGTLTNRHPAGDLFGMVYGEVPYLDVLQTTTNPALPLTELEYDEFGDPLHRPEDLAFWVKYSPVTNIPNGGIPALKVLCRTGENDTQVYAYEPVKWIRGLRGSTPASGAGPKLLGVRAGEGHFFSKVTARRARAEDCVVLDFWTFSS